MSVTEVALLGRPPQPADRPIYNREERRFVEEGVLLR